MKKHLNQGLMLGLFALSLILLAQVHRQFNPTAVFASAFFGVLAIRAGELSLFGGAEGWLKWIRGQDGNAHLARIAMGGIMACAGVDLVHRGVGAPPYGLVALGVVTAAANLWGSLRH
ncbi:hypothetical protein [Cupriavidus metallidurans]|uniref:hypothetical protein n=1 Tax=Cupriavidus metallidurans TaxID=119219 RepID=UPI000CE06439|nr:hypothetical protein [Cupriavidus metallidurans]AVA38252.1 hypothetical protein C3Z06_32115 [Cupriavidus metallidurans]